MDSAWSRRDKPNSTRIHLRLVQLGFAPHPTHESRLYAIVVEDTVERQDGMTSEIQAFILNWERLRFSTRLPTRDSRGYYVLSSTWQSPVAL